MTYTNAIDKKVKKKSNTETIIAKYGKDFFKNIGKKGGSRGSAGKGFSSIRKDENGLTGSERARIAGRKGGLARKDNNGSKEQ